MIFTEEQFKEILDGDEGIYMDDLPFETQGLEFFNSLPDHLQGEAMQWGFGDTCVRENIFVFLLENQFGLTPEQYYATGILDKYFETKIPIPIDYKRLKMTKRELMKEKLDSKCSTVSYENKEKRTSFDENFGKDKMDIAKKVIGDRTAELLNKLNGPMSMEVAAKTIGLDLVEVKPGGSRIDCVSPTIIYPKENLDMIKERYCKSVVNLLDKEYNGFESLFDLNSDIENAMDNDIIPSEMSGSIRIRIDYIPSEEDCEHISNIKNL